MSKFIFISDIHLSQETPEITNSFIKFLNSEVVNCDALYILGDLFEVWIGDDDPNPLHKIISDNLQKLSIPIFFIHGNRDFLLSKKFAIASGIILLPEEYIITIYGLKILIMHGDTLCTKDKIYQIFRKKMKSHILQKLFLNLPLYIRKYIASNFRVNSIKNNKKKSTSLLDIDSKKVNEIMIQKQVQILIHGHIHDPKIYLININNQNLQRVVLGSWNKKKTILQFDCNGLKLIDFNF